MVQNPNGIAHSGPNISLSTIDSNLFGNSCYYNSFAGDSHLYSYWGVSINLNSAGNNPSGNAGNARIPNTSSFTINQRPVGGGAGSTFTNLFTVLQNGNVGIGTTTPSTSLYVSGTTILNNATTCTSSLNVSGLTTLSGNLDCGGGIAINGSNAFYIDTSVDAVNKTNTYINFKMAGATNDWCYLRQIGGAENFKLTFDFLDDVDARFCIRSISPYSTPNDTVIECFTVDNGNVTCTGYLKCGNNVWNRSADGVYRTYYATNEISYYCCGGNSTIGHIFYNNSYSNVFQIKNNGDIQSTGKINLNGELVNGNWKMTNDSDYCRLYNNAGTSYFNFAAQILYANTSLQVNTTANINGNSTIGGNIVCSGTTTLNNASTIIS